MPTASFVNLYRKRKASRIVISPSNKVSLRQVFILRRFFSLYIRTLENIKNFQRVGRRQALPTKEETIEMVVEAVKKVDLDAGGQVFQEPLASQCP